MATATLTTMLTGVGAVQIVDGEHTATYKVTHKDGPGPAAAVATVLAASGWQVCSRWEQVSGGVTGGQWTAQVVRADEVEATAIPDGQPVVNPTSRQA